MSEEINKNHCCPFCGSDNIRINAQPSVHVLLDDEGLCEEVVDDWGQIYQSINELGPEDFEVRCNSCRKRSDIVFEEGGPSGKMEWRLEKPDATYADYEQKYRLLYQYKQELKKEKHHA